MADSGFDATIPLTIHHHGEPHQFSLPAESTLQDLSTAIAETLSVPTDNQKLMIAPKPGMLKPPFAAAALSSLPLQAPKFKITLFGSTSGEINSMNDKVSNVRQSLKPRPMSPYAISASSVGRQRPSGGVHTLSSPSASGSNYTFHRLLPLAHLPNPSRSHDYLARLRDDPGIRFAMQKHRFSVPLLTEMDPAEHTTMESRTLGLNRNKGEVIELRLRTDAYDGYRDYRTIRRTLCHELAHCVHSDHDRHFWDLTKQIEKEVESSDWTSGGHRLTQEEFYNPDDWESMQQRGGEEAVDHGGWTGGEFVLGGLAEDASNRTERPALSRREILARAAEERMKRESQQGRSSGGDSGTES